MDDLSEPFRLTFLAFLRAIEHPDANGKLLEAKLSRLTDERVGLGVARAALEELVRLDYIKRFNDPNAGAMLLGGPFFYQLSAKGAEAAFKIDLRATNTSQVADQMGNTKWEALPHEWTEDDAASAVKAVENALEGIRGHNGLATSQPDTHKRLVWSLSAGLDALKKRLPSRQEVVELVYKPLKWVAETFAKSTLGELGKDAAKHVARLLGFGS